MAIYVANIVIEQGFSFSNTFEIEDTRTGRPVNLTGYDLKAELRKTYSSPSFVSFGTTSLFPERGSITIELEPDATDGFRPGRYVYDIKITTASGNEYKAVEGAALLRGGVTR